MTRFSIKRFVYSTIGVLLISIAVSIFRFANIGTDPYSCFNLGISNLTGLSFGDSQLATNLVLTVFLIIPGWKFFGISTITSMVLIGYVSDFILTFITADATDVSLIVKIILVCIGITVTSTGIALYSSANLGIGQYDAIGFTIVNKSKGKLKLGPTRIVVDLLLILFGYLFGSTVGIGTVLIALGVGPLVGYLIAHVTDPFIQRVAAE